MLKTHAAQWWPIPLRLVVGYGFLAHGFAKLLRGAGAFAAVLHALGVPFPSAMALATIGIELVGGAAVLLGAWVRLAVGPLAIVMIVAALSVHLPYGFSSIKLVEVTATGPRFGPPGYEVNLMYLASLVALAVGGSGPLSLEKEKRR